MKNRLLLLFLFPLLLFGADIDHEIVVKLEKEAALPKIYISCTNPNMKEVLLFDFSNNGATEAVSDKTEEEKQLNSDAPFSPSFHGPRAGGSNPHSGRGGSDRRML